MDRRWANKGNHFPKAPITANKKARREAGLLSVRDEGSAQ
jgi:hypothetical protein